MTAATRAVAGPASLPDRLDELRRLAGSVPDPEIPVLTLDDLGILRDVTVISADGADTLVVTLTPTYTGCPATAVIAADVESVLRSHGVPAVRVRTVLSPAWTTDWISDDGRRKLTEFGIAPPHGRSESTSAGAQPVALGLTARCPRCGSTDTREVSRFGSTPCKALWSCRRCLEPFDSFKSL